MYAACVLQLAGISVRDQILPNLRLFDIKICVSLN